MTFNKCLHGKFLIKRNCPKCNKILNNLELEIEKLLVRAVALEGTCNTESDPVKFSGEPLLDQLTRIAAEMPHFKSVVGRVANTPRGVAKQYQVFSRFNHGIYYQSMSIEVLKGIMRHPAYIPCVFYYSLKESIEEKELNG